MKQHQEDILLACRNCRFYHEYTTGSDYVYSFINFDCDHTSNKKRGDYNPLDGRYTYLRKWTPFEKNAHGDCDLYEKIEPRFGWLKKIFAREKVHV